MGWAATAKATEVYLDAILAGIRSAHESCEAAKRLDEPGREILETAPAVSLTWLVDPGAGGLAFGESSNLGPGGNADPGDNLADLFGGGGGD